MRRWCAWEEPQGIGRGRGVGPKSSGNMIRILTSDQDLKEGSAYSGIVIQDLLPHISTGCRVCRVNVHLSVTDHARDCNHASQHTLDAFRDLDPDGAEYVV